MVSAFFRIWKENIRAVLAFATVASALASRKRVQRLLRLFSFWCKMREEKGGSVSTDEKLF